MEHSKHARLAFLVLWLTYFTLASPLRRHQLDSLSRDDAVTPRRRQANAGFFAVTGVTDTGIQPRLEIRQMQNDTDLFNIFILGLQRFMRSNQSEMLSYYQVAGIHGRPYISWDSGGAVPTTGSNGYCTHSSNLFLTWHRAYLLLFEQLLFENIIDAVNDFPAGAVRQRYAAAAMRCRLPYWDWAMLPADGQNYPAILQAATVPVTLPNGTGVIPNPLYAYNFHPLPTDDFFFNPWASWPMTLRNPTNMTSLAESDNAGLGPALNNIRNGLMNRLYNLFTYYSNYTQFGNDAWITSDIRNADSLESLHNIIHVTAGMQGHMSYFDYAAFDPLFWLHHAMIDRCFALWQVVWPDGRMEDRTAVTATFAVNVGDPEDPITPLQPFRKSAAGDFLASLDVWHPTKYGYTYPELTGNPTVASVKASINKLYGSNAAAGGLVARDKAASQAASYSDLRGAPGAVVEGRYRNYLANIVSPRFALNGSYAIYLFLGESSDKSTQRLLSPNFVGVHDVFAGLKSAAMEVHSEVKVAGSVPLTDALLDKVASGELRSMDSNSVATYLHENLQWLCSTVDGIIVDPANIPGLSVSVVSAEVDPASSVEQFPGWSNFTELRAATEGRIGGWRRS